MSDETSVLVLGMDELASAVARKLHLAGHAVAIHQPTPPQTLRRGMSFADAWTDGTCAFEGVEAHRADKSKDFLVALRSGAFIPVLRHPFDDVTARWPWDVIVDARTGKADAPEKLRIRADFTIGLGRLYCAGDNCDVAIDIGARDPGAVVRRGSIVRAESAEDARFADGQKIVARGHGVFRGARRIGDLMAKGDVIGCVGSDQALAPAPGRIRGLARDGAAVARGAEIAEIVSAPNAEFVGITRRDKLIARSVAFVIEMERAGYAPISLENFL